MLQKKVFPVVIVQLLILLFLGMWAIHGEEEEIYTFENCGEISDIFLPRGTYRAYISYESETGKNAGTFITDSNDEAFKADILQFYEWKNIDYLQLWAYKDFDDIRFVCDESYGYLNITHISIARTKEIKRMAWTIVLAGIIVLDVIFLWVYYLQKHKKERKEIIFSSMVLIIVTMLVSWPLFMGRLINAHDLVFHLSRIEGMKDAFLAKQIPVRIQTNWFEGAGYAVSVLYGDVLLYPFAFLRILGFPLQFVYKCYVFMINLGTAYFTYYAFRKISAKRQVALFGTILYTLAPYRIGDLYLRAAIGEATAMMFFPLLSVGFYRIWKASDSEEYKNIWIMPAVAMTGILTSHTISAVMVAICLFFWCIFQWKEVLVKEKLLALIRTVGGTIGLSAGFLIPFFDYYFTQSLSVNRATDGTEALIAEHGFSWHEMCQILFGAQEFKVLGMVFLIMVFLLVCLYFVTLTEKKEEKRIEKEVVVLFLLSCLFLWMSTKYFPWNYLATKVQRIAVVERNIQFPFRFAGVFLAFLSLLSVVVLSRVSVKRLVKAFLFAVCLIVVFTSGLYMKEIREKNTMFKIYDLAGMGLLIDYGVYSTFIVCGGEYVPVGTDIMDYRWQNLRYDKLEVGEWHKEHGRVILLVNNNQNQPEELSVPILFYKGYRARVPGKKMELCTYPGEQNRVTVEIPGKFSNIIEIAFFEPWYWRFSEAVSVFCCLWMIAHTAIHGGKEIVSGTIHEK